MLCDSCVHASYLNCAIFSEVCELERFETSRMTYNEGHSRSLIVSVHCQWRPRLFTTAKFVVEARDYTLRSGPQHSQQSHDEAQYLVYDRAACDGRTHGPCVVTSSQRQITATTTARWLVLTQSTLADWDWITVTHPSTNRARRASTWFNVINAITTTQSLRTDHHNQPSQPAPPPLDQSASHHAPYSRVFI